MCIRLGHIAFALIVASILNLTIAWLCAYYAVPGYRGAIVISADEFDNGAEIVVERDSEIAATTWASFGVTELDYYGAWRIRKESKSFFKKATSDYGYGAKLDRIFSNVRLNNDPSRLINFRFYLNSTVFDRFKHHTRIDAGWPMLSFRGFISGSSLDPNNVKKYLPGQEHTVLAFDRLLSNKTIPRYVSYRPIWFGLIANTLLYASVIIAIMWILIALRSKIRLRCNLCPRCKYPIGVSEVCTECGRALPVEKIGCH